MSRGLEPGVCWVECMSSARSTRTVPRTDDADSVALSALPFGSSVPVSYRSSCSALARLIARP